MGALAERTETPPETLRSWERRYGFPQPKRTTSNRRLYSERDIEAIVWLKDQTSQGQGIREAIDMLQHHLAVNARPDPSPSQRAHTQEKPLIDEFAIALGRNRFDDAQDAWDHLAVAASPAALGERVILAMIDRLEALSPSALAFLQRKATVLLDGAEPDRGAPTIGLLTSAGDVPGIACTVLAAALARNGARVITPFSDFRSLDSITRLRAMEPNRVVVVRDDEASIDTGTLTTLLGVESIHSWILFDRHSDEPDVQVRKLVERLTGP